jgi:NADH-quinone oxidoreductase subunit H
VLAVSGLVWMLRSSWGALTSLIVGFLLANLMVAGALSIWALFSFEALMGIVWFLLKSFTLVALFVLMRATFPRVRMDQLMGFAWKWMMPAALLNIFVTAGAILVVKELAG